MAFIFLSTIVLLLSYYVNSLRFSFIKPQLQFPSINKFYLKGVSRTGVRVPEDVAIFGRTIINYECLYEKDGKIQTGDEWEAEMKAETKTKFREKAKLAKKKHKVEDKRNEVDEGFERFEFPALFDPTKMLLRDGVPYLIISCWAPGIKIDQLNVFVNYLTKPSYPQSYYDQVSELHKSEELESYYETCENEPFEKPHKYSYHSTYNDLFNRMEKSDFGFADTDSEITKPPIILINFPKNTIVNQWEYAHFSSKRDITKKDQSSKVQRAYRPFSHIDLRDISCIYNDSTLQIRMKLTHIPPPLEFQRNYRLTPTTGEIKPPKTLPIETVHGWMYNWHYFQKYDLGFDLSKSELPSPEEVQKPDFVDDMTPKDLRRFIKEVESFDKLDA